MTSNDFPKSTVAILLVIAVVTTIISSWAIYSHVNAASEEVEVFEPANSNAAVHLEILQAPEPVKQTGEVSLEILPQQEE